MSPDETTRRQEVGALVRRARHRLGLTIDDAAKLVSMSPVTWGNVEAGQRVRPLTLARIEKALSWPPECIEGYLSSGEGLPKIDEMTQASHGPASQPDRPRPPALDLAAAIDTVLESELPDARKIALIQALRDVKALEPIETPEPTRERQHT